MLDLNFVRENLSLVEAKLRLRGMNPAEVLQDFAMLDTQRRQAITEAETTKARRNRLSEEIAKARRAAETPMTSWRKPKPCASRFRRWRNRPPSYEARMQQILDGIPNLPSDTVPVGQVGRGKRRSSPLGQRSGI